MWLIDNVKKFWHPIMNNSWRHKSMKFLEMAFNHMTSGLF